MLDEVPGSVPTTKIFHRGDHRQPTKPVRPGDLSIAAPEGMRYEIPEKDPSLPTSGRRLAYARHLVKGDHPLVGRVVANRIWLHHFGRGLVDTPGDFGVLGTRPTHPELLDWLADRLARQGWSLKRMHKLIMMSAVYRQSSRANAASSAADSSNSLYSHFPLRRLEAEEIRDVILHLSGRLDEALYGPPVPVAEDTVGHILPDQRLGEEEPLSSGPAVEARVATGDVRLSYDGGQLRPQGTQHLGHAIARAHEQRVHPEPRRPPGPARAQS